MTHGEVKGCAVIIGVDSRGPKLNGIGRSALSINLSLMRSFSLCSAEEWFDAQYRKRKYICKAKYSLFCNGGIACHTEALWHKVNAEKLF